MNKKQFYLRNLIEEKKLKAQALENYWTSDRWKKDLESMTWLHAKAVKQQEIDSKNCPF